MGHLNAASGAMSLVLLLVLAFPSLVISLCECGYSASDPNNAELTWVFTDLLESDFTKIQNISQSQKWERQQFNVTAEDGRGKYGKAFMADNIDTELSPSEEGSSSRDDLGLGFRVGGALDNNSVPVAELDSTRMDLHWGSYRAGMKVTGVKGTCAAFFWVSPVYILSSLFLRAGVPSPTSTSLKSGAPVL